MKIYELRELASESVSASKVTVHAAHSNIRAPKVKVPIPGTYLIVLFFKYEYGKLSA